MTGPEVLITSILKALKVQIDPAQLTAAITNVVNTGPQLLQDTHARIAAIEQRLEGIERAVNALVETHRNDARGTPAVN